MEAAEGIETNPLQTRGTLGTLHGQPSVPAQLMLETTMYNRVVMARWRDGGRMPSLEELAIVGALRGAYYR